MCCGPLPATPQHISVAKLCAPSFSSFLNISRHLPCLFVSAPCCREKDPKHIYYLSAEFLMGRTLTNAVNNLDLGGEYAEVGRWLGGCLGRCWPASASWRQAAAKEAAVAAGLAVCLAGGGWAVGAAVVGAASQHSDAQYQLR
jgi:hypothetical protein